MIQHGNSFGTDHPRNGIRQSPARAAAPYRQSGEPASAEIDRMILRIMERDRSRLIAWNHFRTLRAFLSLLATRRGGCSPSESRSAEAA